MSIGTQQGLEEDLNKTSVKVQEKCQSTHYSMEYDAKFINIDRADLGENPKAKTEFTCASDPEVEMMPLGVRTKGSPFTLSQFSVQGFRGGGQLRVQAYYQTV